MDREWVKTVVTKKGVTVILRSPRPSDADELTRYANELSREDTFVVLSGETIARKEEEELIDKWLLEIEHKDRFHILAFIDGSLVANADLRRVTKSRKRQRHVGEISISVAKNWRGHGLGRLILEELIQQGKSMGLRMITLTTFAVNVRAFELYKSMGFQVVGEIPGAILYRGKYVGHVYMYLPLT